MAASLLDGDAPAIVVDGHENTLDAFEPDTCAHEEAYRADGDSSRERARERERERERGHTHTQIYMHGCGQRNFFLKMRTVFCMGLVAFVALTPRALAPIGLLARGLVFLVADCSESRPSAMAGGGLLRKPSLGDGCRLL